MFAGCHLCDTELKMYATLHTLWYQLSCKRGYINNILFRMLLEVSVGDQWGMYLIFLVFTFAGYILSVCIIDILGIPLNPLPS